MNRTMREIDAILSKRGWTWERTGAGHLKWRHKDGAIMFTSSSPSDFRVKKKVLLMAKRMENGESR